MKLKSAVLSMALLAVGAGAASAGSWYVGGNVGAGIPMGDYGDVAATGWNAGLTATNVGNGRWGFGADLGYHSWNASDDVQDALLPDESIKWNAMQATGHAMYRFPTQSHAKPYVKFGAGLYNLGFKYESDSGDLDESESKFGFNFGAGMQFATQSNMVWGFNGAYHIVSAEDDLGTDANVFTLGLNVMWGLGQ